MLEELAIHNYALIDRVNVKFSEGLNLLTGETGAGKSILVGALGLILGQKTDGSAIRTGAEEALIYGIVNVSKNREAREWLQERGIAVSDDTVILRRVVKQSGRGSIYIGSTPSTRTDLNGLASLLFDLHGQHEHQSLLNVENHRKLIDRYGNTEEAAKRFFGMFMELASQKEKLSKLVSSERERLRQIDFLEHAITEITNAQLKPGEEEQLEKEHKILANHERLFRLVEEIYHVTSESKGGALSSLRKAREDMEEIVQIDTGLSALGNQLQDAFYEIEDFVESIRQYRSSVEYNPKRLSECEERLDLLRNLKKKYGDTIEEVLAFCRKSEEELEGIQNWEEEKQRLKQSIAGLEADVKKLAGELSAQRKKSAGILQSRIENELKDLGMPKVRFKVDVKEKKNPEGKTLYTPYGIDVIEFVISPNPGEPFKPLKKIASGGEISRVMLALKSVLAEEDHISSLIFDEVDAGIGGEVAISVGEKLKNLSQKKQILCITHLATIAARADNHIKVEKYIKDNRTFTRVYTIRGQAVKEEISRMLSGDSKTEVSLRHAEELLTKYGTS
ncbi:MAG: DNA repair protein RecN [Spirochaetales bacterium]|nr:DNA repair protein RecN [Spirochaetales bacterium]